MTALVCCSYLRAYQPLASFPEAEREGIERCVGDPASASSAQGRPPLSLLARDECLDTYVKVMDGRVYACAGRNRLRTILGMIAFERALPTGASSVFFTEREMRDARGELERIQSARPDLRPSIAQSAWHVPLRWFVCFADTERRIEHDGTHARIRYETRVGTAGERVREALETLKGGVVHPVIVGMLFEMREWLATFEAESILELDYASVSTLFDPEELADDHSATDVWAAIHALGAGDGMAAGLHYRRANERWVAARRRQDLN